MDYEKKYNEALQKIRELIERGKENGWTIITYEKEFEKIFPELVESEDEKIRGAIIDHLKDNNLTEWAAWLEKQGDIDKASYDIAEKEKYDFVNGQFIECRKSFNEFEEDKSYWFEYIGNDTYIGRSDNILNKKFHITPRQLYRLFTQQHSPKENNVNEETNAPTGYGKYIDECLYEAARHFFSEGEDKYCVADLFYAGVRCGQSCLEKQGEEGTDPRCKYLYELLRADDIHQMAMNDNMVQEAKTKAINALSELGIGKLLGLERQGGQKHLELKAGHWYFCHSAYCCRADNLTVKEGERFRCEKDGVVKGFVIKEPAKYFIECDAPALMEGSQILANSAKTCKDEQKPADNVEPKFKLGKWIVWQNKCYKVNYNGYGYELTDQMGLRTSLEYGTVDESAQFWTIKDAKDGDVLCASDGSIFIFKEVVDSGCKHYIALEEKDGTIQVNDNFADFCESVLGVCPATKEQRDTLMKAMTDAGWEFDFEKKELKEIGEVDDPKDYNSIDPHFGKKIEMRPSWSEEDERLCQCLIGDQEESLDKVSNDKYSHSEIISDLEEMYHERIDWLKSIKDRIGG